MTSFQFQNPKNSQDLLGIVKHDSRPKNIANKQDRDQEGS